MKRGKRGHRSERALAASFVVTVTALPAVGFVVGCKKTSDGDDTSGPDTARIYRDYGGQPVCRYSVPEHCPKNATCNPPPPKEVDCPPDLRDAGDPPVVTRRPPGKEDWVRVRPVIWPDEPHCSVGVESFCAPAGKPISCTTPPEPPKNVACARAAGDAGPRKADDVYKVSSFVWKDGVGTCHKTPAIECVANKRCDLPEGEIVPCQ